LKHKHPLPAVQPSHTVHSEYYSGKRPANNAGQGNGSGEDSGESPPIGLREPQAQVENHSWEESGLGHTQQQTQRKEALRPAYKCVQGCQQSPDEHDAEDGAPRSKVPDENSGGHLEYVVGDEEKSGTKAK